MRQEPPQEVEDRRLGGMAGVPDGRYQLSKGGTKLMVIASTLGGWDHVSVSTSTRCPTWEEMCWVKGKFFEPHEVVMQLHVAAEDHLSHHPYCLHLWRPQVAEEIATAYERYNIFRRSALWMKDDRARRFDELNPHDEKPAPWQPIPLPPADAVAKRGSKSITVGDRVAVRMGPPE